MTDIIMVPVATFAFITVFIVAIRIFDAVNDPFMGLIVDNTKTRYGKFKPWIAFGAFTTAIIIVLIFSLYPRIGISATEAEIAAMWTRYAIIFCILYFIWEIVFTTNDIAYWSMLPSLSFDQKEREKIGSIARVCANVGLFFVVAGIVPLTGIFSDIFGSPERGWLAFAIMVVVIMVAGQLITLLGVKEPHATKVQKSTPIRELLRIIFKNDQLLFTAIAMTLFMIGYMTTTTFGLYYFVYIYGDENMFPIFAVILGVSQIAALLVYPLLSKKWNRRTLFTLAIVLVVVGYIVFFFAPAGTMLFVGIAGVLLFVGQGFIQLMMLMFLADSVDYGHLKLGKRNDSITFSLQPFINKLSGAIGNGVVAFVIIIAGIMDAADHTEVTEEGAMMIRLAMFAFPLVCIVVSFIIYRLKYIIDEKKYAEILSELKKKGELESK
jgi:melibiose permease/lactose/raffinose/galactose permease